MLPTPSLCLNVPKTGTTYTARFMAAADWLHLRRACRIRRLRLPNRAEVEAVNAVKRLGAGFGNLNPRLAQHHADYSTWPARLRSLPTLCTLRDVEGWYGSFHLYYTRRMKRTQLERAIRFLVHGERLARDPGLRAILLRHRDAFLDRFARERAASVEDISVGFLHWFNRTVRAEYALKRRTGLDRLPAPIGFLTFRTILLLFEDPARVFGLSADAFHDYFAGGRYRRDLRADFYLGFDTLTADLCALMAGELGYDPGILGFLAESYPRQNVSPEDRKLRVVEDLNAGGLIERIRRRERIYERYLLPLAGAGARDDRPARQLPFGGPRREASAR